METIVCWTQRWKPVKKCCSCLSMLTNRSVFLRIVDIKVLISSSIWLNSIPMPSMEAWRMCTNLWFSLMTSTVLCWRALVFFLFVCLFVCVCVFLFVCLFVVVVGFFFVCVFFVFFSYAKRVGRPGLAVLPLPYHINFVYVTSKCSNFGLSCDAKESGSWITYKW